MALFGRKSEPAKPARVQAEATQPEDPDLEILEPGAGSPAYGIQDAIKLMRSLPVDENTDLVVRVVKSTLESMNVSVADIVEDANRQEATLTSQMEELTREIDALGAVLEGKRREFAKLEGTLSETRLVKERLLLTTDGSLAGHRPVTVPPIPPQPGPITSPPPPPMRTPPPPRVRPSGVEASRPRTDPPGKPLLRSSGPAVDRASPSSPPPSRTGKAERLEPRKAEQEKKADKAEKSDPKRTDKVAPSEPRRADRVASDSKRPEKPDSQRTDKPPTKPPEDQKVEARPNAGAPGSKSSPRAGSGEQAAEAKSGPSPASEKTASSEAAEDEDKKPASGG